MSSEHLSIISNVYSANLLFDKEIEDFDIFRVDGITSDQTRYKLLGRVVEYIQYQEKASFAQYTPSPHENFVVGFLPKGPSIKDFELEGLQVTYKGKANLPPTSSGRRTLTDLLNKTKARELRNILWSSGGHSFYPKRGKDLRETYRNCNLIMFRGPFFRYNVLTNHKIILTLDSSTHYISSEPFLTEIRKRGGLDWFIKEIQRRKKIAESRRRRFSGIHFFYDLYKNDVAVDDVDPRPISEILLPKPLTVNGKECKTVAEYLMAKYSRNPAVSKLDDSQPGLRQGTYTFAPQFLYQTIPLEEIPDNILNDQTFFMDRSPPLYRDIQRPAKVRWEKIKQYYYQYFQYADLGLVQLKMSDPLAFPISSQYEVPKLLTGGGEPVSPKEI